MLGNQIHLGSERRILTPMSLRILTIAFSKDKIEATHNSHNI